ncbi:MAG: PqqD family protein [Silvibacterium sp.]
MPTPAARVHSVVERDGAAILDIEHGAILTLNPTGGYVWGRLKQGHSLEKIVEELANETGVEASMVNADVRAFVDQLKVRGLLED